MTMPVYAVTGASGHAGRYAVHQLLARGVLLGARRLVGMISEADLATHLPEAKIAEFAYRIYSAPPSL
jgi:NAD(P)-dependent dehydrogenase (short-subunit alcohol dehydrogenase family)